MVNSMHSLDNFDPQGEIQMPVGSMTFNLLNSCFKISSMSNIKKSKKWLTTPCNLFYSSKSMMEICDERKFVINSEQNINVDKTLLKLSLQDMFKFNEAIEIISKDLAQYNKETGNF